MGNRAVITTEDKQIGIYVHWNGGRESVETFLAYCDMKNYRPPETDCYGWARMCQVIGNFFGNSTNPIEIRDSAMLHIFLNCGLRLSEIKNLNIEDINLNDDKFTIIGKGNKERTNYLNDITKEALLKYLNIRDNSHDKGRNNPLFLTDYGFRMSVTTIKKIVKRAYRKANLDENIYSVHTLRHTCATILYKAGCNIRTIQELLGHVQIDTTEIYTHLHDQEVMDVMLNHPLAQYKIADALAYCA